MPSIWTLASSPASVSASNRTEAVTSSLVLLPMPPAGAVRGEVDLLYQTTSWEYIQFLWLANEGNIAFLADEGDNMLSAWLNEGMSEPFVMASTTVVPEPGQAMLLVAGAAFLLGAERRRVRR